MYRKTLNALLVAAFALTTVAPAFAQAPKPEPPKTPPPSAAVPAPHQKLANEVAVCACGMVFVPGPQTKTFTYEGKEYACCSEECHKKLASMSPADAAKACMDQVQKLEKPAPGVEKK